MRLRKRRTSVSARSYMRVRKPVPPLGNRLMTESEIETRKLTEAFSAAAPADAKAKVDKLIREIDKCISYLEEA